MTTYTFAGVKGVADYVCPCSACGKALKRKAIVEHTVNPFNKNEAGNVKTPSEVRRAAYAAAAIEAAKLEGVPSLCRACEDAPNRALLLEMAADPTRVFPEPPGFYGSPMDVLNDRKHVERVRIKCECGSDCCSGHKRSPGFRITAAGLRRASTASAQ